MINIYKTGLTVTLALTIVACTSPRDQCIIDTTRTYTVLTSAIYKTELNISRGYAIHKQSVPYTYSGSCYNGYYNYSCPKTSYRTQETPVAVNVDEERRRLKSLYKRLPGVKALAEKGIAQCKVTFPA